MVDGIVEIAEDGRHLSLYRGFLIVTGDDRELGRIALDDISALIISANQASISKNILTALTERNAIIICCGARYLPTSITMPYSGNYEQAHRIRHQISASQPLCKQIWKRIIKEKIANQAAVLHWRNRKKTGEILEKIKIRVRSGDPDNMEGQAARHYWSGIFKDGFVRNRYAEDENILFNYCYTVLRACVARAVVAAGLIPALGVHHRSRLNPYALVDDLMEPYRPLADSLVLATIDEYSDTAVNLTPTIKRSLVRILRLDMRTKKGISPLTEVVQRLVLSLSRSYENAKEGLEFGNMILPAKER